MKRFGIHPHGDPFRHRSAREVRSAQPQSPVKAPLSQDSAAKAAPWPLGTHESGEDTTWKCFSVGRFPQLAALGGESLPQPLSKSQSSQGFRGVKRPGWQPATCPLARVFWYTTCSGDFAIKTNSSGGLPSHPKRSIRPNPTHLNPQRIPRCAFLRSNEPTVRWGNDLSRLLATAFGVLSHVIGK